MPWVQCTRRLSSRSKAVKSFFWYSSVMPMPVSFTAKWVHTQPSPLREGSCQRWTSMRPPAGVNFMALLRKLRSTWLRRTPSQKTCSESMLETQTSNSCLWATNWGRTMSHRPSMASRRERFSTFSVILPLSILGMSRTSLMRPSSCLPETMILP